VVKVHEPTSLREAVRRYHATRDLAELNAWREAHGCVAGPRHTAPTSARRNRRILGQWPGMPSIDGPLLLLRSVYRTGSTGLGSMLRFNGINCIKTHHFSPKVECERELTIVGRPVYERIISFARYPNRRYKDVTQQMALAKAKATAIIDSAFDAWMATRPDVTVIQYNWIKAKDTTKIAAALGVDSLEWPGDIPMLFHATNNPMHVAGPDDLPEHAMITDRGAIMAAYRAAYDSGPTAGRQRPDTAMALAAARLPICRACTHHTGDDGGVVVYCGARGARVSLLRCRCPANRWPS